MADQAMIDIIKTEGYHLFEKPHPHSPGHTGLLVAIRETPTEQHFDPESIELSLNDSTQTAGPTRLTLESSNSGVYHVCPGKVILRDRMDKRVYFFAYGGSLETSFLPGTAMYCLQSPAPILLMAEGLETVPELLAAETEMYLARLHARWGADDEGFRQRLAAADPMQLYAATVQSMLTSYKRSSAWKESYHALYETLLGEKEWLTRLGRWPTTTGGLRDLLMD
ncbi:MAG: hypothetical protein FOGNACKC_01776 [Anaerolineae bacterium]|nr:hypothetical protein [Anaerolineae bacterium]